MTAAATEDSPRIKAIVLDFDGVILESNHVKAETFRRLFSQYPQHAEAIVKLHRDHGGMARQEKLRIICEDIIGRPVDREGIRRLSKEFGRLADDAMMMCPFTPGAPKFLQTYSDVCPLFIATGTPEDEMQPLIERRGLAQLFAGVYGSPRDKAAILRDVLAENGWRPSEMVFVGDSIDDYKGAQATSVPFIGRIAPGKADTFTGTNVSLIVESLVELHQIWQGVPTFPITLKHDS